MGLLYWIIDQPRRVGFTVAFAMGLLMDVAEGALLGQHALSYTVLTYAAVALARRVRMFSPASQAFHVLPLLLLGPVISQLLGSTCHRPSP